MVAVGRIADRTDDAMSGGQSIEQVIFHTAAIDLARNSYMYMLQCTLESTWKFYYLMDCTIE